MDFPQSESQNFFADLIDLRQEIDLTRAPIKQEYGEPETPPNITKLLVAILTTLNSNCTREIKKISDDISRISKQIELARQSMEESINLFDNKNQIIATRIQQITDDTQELTRKKRDRLDKDALRRQKRKQTDTDIANLEQQAEASLKKLKLLNESWSQ